jgi:hypothetical protein
VPACRSMSWSAIWELICARKKSWTRLDGREVGFADGVDVEGLGESARVSFSLGAALAPKRPDPKHETREPSSSRSRCTQVVGLRDRPNAAAEPRLARPTYVASLLLRTPAPYSVSAEERRTSEQSSRASLSFVSAVGQPLDGVSGSKLVRAEQTAVGVCCESSHACRSRILIGEGAQSRGKQA